MGVLALEGVFFTLIIVEKTPKLVLEDPRRLVRFDGNSLGNIAFQNKEEARLRVSAEEGASFSYMRSGAFRCLLIRVSGMSFPWAVVWHSRSVGPETHNTRHVRDSLPISRPLGYWNFISEKNYIQQEHI